MDIKITCKTDTYLPLEKIKDFQGELKIRTDDDVDHLISSIEKHGFFSPIFIWRQPDGTCSCLDGHGRVLALTKLQKEGNTIPGIPVIYIDAKDEAEARTKLIYINTTSGRFTEVGFRDLVKDIPDLDLSDFTYPELDLEKIDLEMKILAQAQMSIQTNVSSDWDFDANELNDFPSMDEPVLGTAGSETTHNPIAGTVPTTAGYVNTANAAPLPTQESMDTSPDPEPEVKELVVYCQDCGQPFLYRYRKDGQPVEQSAEQPTEQTA